MDEKQKVLCPKFEEAVTILSKKWNGLVISLLLENPYRFCRLRDSVDGISDRVLTERLRELQSQGIIAKREIEEKESTYTCYSLTEKGKALEPIYKDIQEWAEKWI